MSKAISLRAPVVENLRFETFCRLTIGAPEIARRAEAGQFVNLLPAALSGPAPAFADGGRPLFLKRPMSVHRIAGPGGATWRPGMEKAAFDVHLEAIGPGTKALFDLRAGDEVDVLGPLGRGYDLRDPPFETAAMVAGGIGVAPFVHVAQELLALGKMPVLLLGVSGAPPLPVSRVPARRLRGRDLTVSSPWWDALGVPVHVASIRRDEGCLPGLVTDLLEAYLDEAGPRSPAVFSCGPWPMMRAVATLCARRGVPDQHLLEEVMGCGVGICVSCVCPVRGEGGALAHRKICRDGPAARGCDVLWEARP